MDITKFFNSKKRDVSNNSNTEEDAKRQRKENPSKSPNVSMLDTPKILGDIFEESLISEDCVKDFTKLLAKFREGSERYPQVGTFQQQQQPN